MPPTLSPQDFVAKWKRSELREQAGYQEHLIDLCRLAGHPTPAEHDPTGEIFAFEARAVKISGGRGRADVYFKGHFAWEYKSRGKNLDLAHTKLDEAVLDAYGWPHDIDDEEILERLLALNLERAKV